MYKKGESTKNSIIEVSKKLFYEQGYKDTTTRQIANELDVNLGLFSYYFKNKAHLATNIYKTIRWELLAALDLHPVLCKDIKLHTAVNVMADICMLIGNYNFGRFYYELSLEPELQKFMHIMVKNSVFRYYDEATNIDSDSLKHEILISTSVIPAAKPTIIYQALKHKYDLSIADYANYYIKMYFYFVFNENESESKKIIKNAHDILSELDFKITENFLMDYNVGALGKNITKESILAYSEIKKINQKSLFWGD